MIKFFHTLYEFDPVQNLFNKCRYQTGSAANQFPDRLKIEKREVDHLNCEIVLTEFNGIKWNLITGLQPVTPGYFTGNKRVFNGTRKTEMLLIHNNGLTGEFHLYHFPGFDTKTARQRIKAAKDFISFLNKKRGNRRNDRPDIFLNINAGQI